VHYFLSQDDLIELTDYQRPADQRRWLESRGIPFWTGASGRPKVLWSDVSHPQAQDSHRTSAPNWSKLPQ
jgi:hypothetical protein